MSSSCHVHVASSTASPAITKGRIAFGMHLFTLLKQASHKREVVTVRIDQLAQYPFGRIRPIVASHVDHLAKDIYAIGWKENIGLISVVFIPPVCNDATAWHVSDFEAIAKQKPWRSTPVLPTRTSSVLVTIVQMHSTWLLTRRLLTLMQLVANRLHSSVS